MKLLAGLLLFIPLVQSASAPREDGPLAYLPDCAQRCIESTAQVSSCPPTDIPCLCADQKFMSAAQACQAQSCTVKEVLISTNATLSACGVPAEDQSGTLLAIAAAFGSTAVACVLVRVGGRLWITQTDLGLDDWLIVAAMAFACVLNYSCIPMSKAGMGKDFWTIPFDDINEAFKLLYIAEIFYMVAEMFVQLSLLAFYLRVFPEGSKLITVGTRALAALAICFGIANTFTMVFQCTPVPFFWTGWSGETVGTCIDINLFSWIRAAIEIAIDIAILSTPLPTLLRLQMSWRMKIQVLIMFSLGFVITIVSILRLRSLIEFSKTQNPTHDNTPAVYWSVLECDIFIICACLPAVRSVISSFAPGLLNSTSNPSHPSGAQNIHHGGSSRDRDPPHPRSSHQLMGLSQSGHVIKSVEVSISNEQRSGSEDDLVYPAHRPV